MSVPIRIYAGTLEFQTDTLAFPAEAVPAIIECLKYMQRRAGNVAPGVTYVSVSLQNAMEPGWENEPDRPPEPPPVKVGDSVRVTPPS